jgi:transcription-repair coupling factor (superfamily II helicase)
MLARRHRVVLVSHQANRLAEILAEEGLATTSLEAIDKKPQPGSLTLLRGILEKGWVMDGTTHLFSDSELFGFLKQQRLARKRPAVSTKLYIDINPGDYVVHVDHGVARFTGITTIKRNSSTGEYLVLEYAAGDRLYVPTQQIERLSRYIGGGGPPQPGRLGSADWIRAKEKAREAAANMAEELMELYAAREVVPGHAFGGDTIWQGEMEASFPYIETPDQLTVQQQIKDDMEKAKPMDRFVLGDVGYGKTEVAVRAAFKAVMEGKQVALLVPTTVLAQQHYVTFTHRLAAFPVRIEVLSRFRTPKEQQVVLEGLKIGAIDICIGTHRLLQLDVVFNDLGLLIIDEEQRFGVAHKEYLKKMRQEVDVVTLSATPIPRTLHMALSGVRDMSLIETPPEERLPVKTYVTAWDERLIREVVLRELERNGQVYFVYNRVQSIEHIRHKLEVLIPEVSFAVGHGQMPEGELERVMSWFATGRIDVLVCTTIIESGLDVPNANTLIVHQADRFGLTQLYQLRGRVGRGANMAYAYFLYDRDRRLSPNALKRLQTMFEASELGAGFDIAMKDLEIRGAGTLLGSQQSGHISAVGFNLYSQLLAEAVEEQKAGREGKSLEELKSSRLPQPSVDLPLAALIPEEYVNDLESRLELYRRLALARRIEQLKEIETDFADRFGSLPSEVHNLLYAVRLKLKARNAGVSAILTEGGRITIRLLEGLRLDENKLRLVLRDGVRPGGNQLRLNLKKLGRDWRQVLEEVLERLG